MGDYQATFLESINPVEHALGQSAITEDVKKTLSEERAQARARLERLLRNLDADLFARARRKGQEPHTNVRELAWAIARPDVSAALDGYLEAADALAGMQRASDLLDKRGRREKQVYGREKLETQVEREALCEVADAHRATLNQAALKIDGLVEPPVAYALRAISGRQLWKLRRVAELVLPRIPC